MLCSQLRLHTPPFKLSTTVEYILLDCAVLIQACLGKLRHQGQQASTDAWERLSLALLPRRMRYTARISLSVLLSHFETMKQTFMSAMTGLPCVAMLLALHKHLKLKRPHPSSVTLIISKLTFKSMLLRFETFEDKSTRTDVKLEHSSLEQICLILTRNPLALWESFVESFANPKKKIILISHSFQTQPPI